MLLSLRNKETGVRVECEAFQRFAFPEELWDEVSDEVIVEDAKVPSAVRIAPEGCVFIKHADGAIGLCDNSQLGQFLELNEKAELVGPEYDPCDEVVPEEVPVEVVRQTMEDFLANLDPDDNSLWTAMGLVRVDVVEAIFGDEINRDDIELAYPGHTRAGLRTQ